MTQAALQLESILSLAYEQRALGRGSPEVNLSLFSKACGLDPEFLPLAEKTVQEYGRAYERCIVTRFRKEFLEKAIKAVKETKRD